MTIKRITGDDLLEKLAELEHDQWVEWSKSIANSETLSSDRLKRWGKLWVPYHMLTHAEQESDRDWARKVLEIINANSEYIDSLEAENKRLWIKRCKVCECWDHQETIAKQEARIDNLLKAVEFLATYSEQDYVMVDGNSIPCGTGSQTAREALAKDKELASKYTK